MWQLNDKHGLRSGPNSANEDKKTKPKPKQNKGATEHQTKKNKTKQQNQKTGTGNVRAMSEGGGNTPPREVRICATMTSQ